MRSADFLYTDVWWWFGQEDEAAERLAAFMPRYQVNGELFARAPTAKFITACRRCGAARSPTR